MSNDKFHNIDLLINTLQQAHDWGRISYHDPIWTMILEAMKEIKELLEEKKRDEQPPQHEKERSR